jgi:hypothetical protein
MTLASSENCSQVQSDYSAAGCCGGDTALPFSYIEHADKIKASRIAEFVKYASQYNMQIDGMAFPVPRSAGNEVFRIGSILESKNFPQHFGSSDTLEQAFKNIPLPGLPDYSGQNYSAKFEWLTGTNKIVYIHESPGALFGSPSLKYFTKQIITVFDVSDSFIDADTGENVTYALGTHDDASEVIVPGVMYNKETVSIFKIFTGGDRIDWTYGYTGTVFGTNDNAAICTPLSFFETLYNAPVWLGLVGTGNYKDLQYPFIANGEFTEADRAMSQASVGFPVICEWFKVVFSRGSFMPGPGFRQLDVMS